MNDIGLYLVDLRVIAPSVYRDRAFIFGVVVHVWNSLPQASLGLRRLRIYYNRRRNH